jgi:hypothetical protein
MGDCCVRRETSKRHATSNMYHVEEKVLELELEGERGRGREGGRGRERERSKTDFNPSNNRASK